MERISIQELAVVLTVKNGLRKKEAEQFVTMIFDVVKDNLMSERLVKIKGLGTFKVIDIEPRESVNVNTGERVLIEGHEKITFTPDTAMKDLVNRPFSQFETVILNDGVDFDAADNAPLPVEEEIEESEALSQPVVDEEAVMMPIDEEPAVTPVEVVDEEPVVLPVVDDEVEESIVEEENVAITEEADEAPILDSVVDEPPVDENEPVESLVNDEEAEPVGEEEVPEPANEELTETTNEEVEEAPVDEESEVTYDEDFEQDADSSSASKTWLWVGLALVACVLSFVGGYQFGVRKAGQPMEIVDSVPVPVKTQAVAPDTVATKVDTIKKKAVVPPAEPTPSPVQPATPPVKEKPQQPPVKAAAAAAAETTPEADYKKYEQMDARVRTGAYRIVGTAKEVTVKEGETVRRIAHRVLGPEMECYVEVYNGIKADAPLTAGQTIKIPKLQLKKKKTQQTINQE